MLQLGPKAPGDTVERWISLRREMERLTADVGVESWLTSNGLPFLVDGVPFGVADRRPIDVIVAASATATPDDLDIVSVSWVPQRRGLILRLGGGSAMTPYAVRCAVETARGQSLIVERNIYVGAGAPALLVAKPAALLVVNGIPLCVNGSKLNAL